MAAILDTLRPGDVISSDLLNRIIAKLNEHETLLTASTPGSGLAISQLVPDDPYRIGDTITILGRDFQFSIGAARVFLNTTQVLNFLPTSTDSRLQFVIPPVPGILEQGTSVDLVVLNQTESLSLPVTLRPRLSVLQGSALVTWRGVVDPVTPVAGQSAIFRYRIESRTNNRATWLISPVIDVATNANVWNASLRVLDATDNEIPSRQLIDLNAGEVRSFSIRLSPVPSGTDGVDFGLSVTGTAEGITAPSGISLFTVGAATAPPDTSITPSLVPDFSAGALAGSILTVPGGQNRQVAVDLALTVAGTYNVSRILSAGTTGWTVTLFIGTNESIPVSAADLAATGSTSRRLRYVVAATTEATAGRIQFLVQRAGQANSNSITLNLVRS